MRAKLIDGVLVYAPRKIKREIDGRTYVTYNPTDEMLAKAGWLPVIETDPPEAPEGYHYEPTYTEEDGKIVQGWVLVKDPDDISDSEALEIIMGGAGYETV
jgi:hypothetical protein